MANKRLQKLYDRIEDFRCKSDVIYAITARGDDKTRQAFLDNLPTVLVETYHRDAVKTAEDPHGVVGLDERDREAFKSICALDNKDLFLKHSFFFMAFYLLPSFRNFFLHGNPATNLPPPPVNSVPLLDLFVRTKLTDLCDDFFAGRLSPSEDTIVAGASPIVVFSEAAVPLYISTCGVALPPK
jgi:hypothetical protein